jgi:hypothetical protein
MKGLPIKIKFTLWYLAVLSLILTVLGTGIYAAMSSRLHSSFDDSLKKRADQIVDFKDIIPIVAGGAFEEETGELISFYFYFDHALVNVSHRQIEIPAGEECINAVLGGENLYKTIELNNTSFTLYAIQYSPEPKRIMLDKFNIDPNNGAGRKKVRFTNPKLPDEIEIEKAVLIVARSTKDLEMALTTLFHILGSSG